MKKLISLTQAQKDAIPEHVRKWIAKGLSTEPADFDTFEKAVKQCYKFAKLNPNIPIIRVKNPFVGAFAAAIANEMLKSKNVYGAVGDAVRGAVGGAVGDAVYGAVDGAVDDAVRGAVGDAVGGAVTSISWHYWMGGSLWAGWQAYIDYYLSVCKLELSIDIKNRAKAYMDAQMSAGYWWANAQFIIVCDRPDTINLDDLGRLHSDDGIAIRWQDKIGLYFSHGQHIPGWIVTNPEKITREHIVKETNVEIQRCMIEKYGVSRYLVDIGAKIIDMDCLSMEGSAPRALMEDDKKNRWLIGSDGSTARVYHMAVPNTVNTCKEAHESICGFDESLVMMEC